MKKKMYYYSLLYAFLMVIFAVLAYLFLDRGFNTKTKVKVSYDDYSEVFYKVNYIDSFDGNVNSEKYISDMVDNIMISYDYNNDISEYVSGYYRYNIEAYLIAYEDDIVNNLWERKYLLMDDKSFVLDENNINNIHINDIFEVDFQKYRKEIYDFIGESGIDVSGYLSVKINIMEYLSFNNLKKDYDNSKSIVINIPLTEDILKISVDNLDKGDVVNYYEFIGNGSMNVLFLLLGTLFFSITISLIIMVIRQFKLIYHKQSKYYKELNRILSKYDDCIVKVNRFYVNRKYNMIYVDNFSELIDVYNVKNKMISFKEYKRGNEAIFVIIDEDNAWIYKLLANELN